MHKQLLSSAYLKISSPLHSWEYFSWVLHHITIPSIFLCRVFDLCQWERPQKICREFESVPEKETQIVHSFYSHSFLLFCRKFEFVPQRKNPEKCNHIIPLLVYFFFFSVGRDFELDQKWKSLEERTTYLLRQMQFCFPEKRWD